MHDVIDTRFGSIRIAHPSGTFAPSPATRVMVKAITDPARALRGQGLDWGCGTGALAIAAALSADVSHVVGLDISEDDILVARRNARDSGVASKTAFYLADSYSPLDPEGQRAVDEIRSGVWFITANPPASEGDDGFTFRHRVLAGATDFLVPGGMLLMQALSAYGPERMSRLLDAYPHFLYDGVVASTPFVPLDLEQEPTLLRQLQDYVVEEERGGPPYQFHDPQGVAIIPAAEAMARYRTHGIPPMARWEVHQLRWVPTLAAPADRAAGDRPG